jgi:hypothetical protein
MRGWGARGDRPWGALGPSGANRPQRRHEGQRRGDAARHLGALAPFFVRFDRGRKLAGAVLSGVPAPDGQKTAHDAQDEQGGGQPGQVPTVNQRAEHRHGCAQQQQHDRKMHQGRVQRIGRGALSSGPEPAMTTAETCEKLEAREKLQATGFTEDQAAGLVDYVDKRLAEQRGKLKNWFAIVLLAQMAIILGGMAFMLFVATLIIHLWK